MEWLTILFTMAIYPGALATYNDNMSDVETEPVSQFINRLPYMSYEEIIKVKSTPKTRKPGPTEKIGEIHLFNMTPITGRGKPYDFQDLKKPSMYGSQPVHVKYFPFVAAIIRDGQVVGVGTLISDIWVLTTAYNCLYGENCNLKVSMGCNSPYLYLQTSPVVKRVTYPYFNYTWHHNVGMMKLLKPIRHNRYRRITRIGTLMPLPHLKLTLVGWGQNGYYPQTLLEKIETTHMPTEFCQQYFFDAEDLIQPNFCIPNTRIGPCHYNFGAPLVNDRKLVVAMYMGTHKCNSNTSYGAYVDLTYYKDWIENTADMPDGISPSGIDYRSTADRPKLPESDDPFTYSSHIFDTSSKRNSLGTSSSSSGTGSSTRSSSSSSDTSSSSSSQEPDIHSLADESDITKSITNYE